MLGDKPAGVGQPELGTPAGLRPEHPGTLNGRQKQVTNVYLMRDRLFSLFEPPGSFPKIYTGPFICTSFWVKFFSMEDSASVENEGRGCCSAKLPPLESSWSQWRGPLPPSLSVKCGCTICAGSAAAQTDLNSCTAAVAQAVLWATQKELDSIPTQSALQSEEGRHRGQGLAAGASLARGVVEHALVDVVTDLLHVLLQPCQVCRAKHDGLAPPKQLGLHV